MENCVKRFRCQEIASNKLGLTGWIQGTGYTGEEGWRYSSPMKTLQSSGTRLFRIRTCFQWALGREIL